MSNFYDDDDRLWDNEINTGMANDDDENQGKNKRKRNKHKRRQLSDQKRQPFESQPDISSSQRWQ